MGKEWVKGTMKPELQAYPFTETGIALTTHQERCRVQVTSRRYPGETEIIMKTDGLPGQEGWQLLVGSLKTGSGERPANQLWDWEDWKENSEAIFGGALACVAWTGNRGMA